MPLTAELLLQPAVLSLVSLSGLGCALQQFHRGKQTTRVLDALPDVVTEVGLESKRDPSQLPG